MESIVELVRNYILLPITHNRMFKEVNVQPSKGCMIVGSMGSGKTQLGLSILCELKTKYEVSAFYITSSQFLKDSEDVLTKLFKSVVESQPSVIFIDDIHEICTK